MEDDFVGELRRSVDAKGDETDILGHLDFLGDDLDHSETDDAVDVRDDDHIPALIDEGELGDGLFFFQVGQTDILRVVFGEVVQDQAGEALTRILQRVDDVVFQHYILEVD